jgi:DNA-nicking Smr family endonuclease
MGDSEIDLHGLRVTEAIARLSEACNRRLRSGNAGPIRVVHGYGSSGRGGDLRNAVREYLDRHAERVEYVPGEKFFNNPGVTIVYPKHPLPAPANPRFPVRSR